MAVFELQVEVMFIQAASKDMSCTLWSSTVSRERKIFRFFFSLIASVSLRSLSRVDIAPKVIRVSVPDVVFKLSVGLICRAQMQLRVFQQPVSNAGGSLSSSALAYIVLGRATLVQGSCLRNGAISS